MTSYAATPPLSMSLCIGDVSFHLSPSDSATSTLPIVRRNIDNACNNDDDTAGGEGGYCIDLCSFTGTLHVNILARSNILSKNSLVKRSQSNKNVTTDKFDDEFILDETVAVVAPPPHMTSLTTEELHPTSPPAIDSSSIAYSATLQKFGGNSSSPFRRVSSGIGGTIMASSNNNGVVNDNIITCSANMNGGVNPLTATVVNHGSNSEKVKC